MDGSDATPPIAEPDQPVEATKPPGSESDLGARAAPRASFWLRELPYFAVLVLTLFGVAYMGFSKQSLVGYWEFLTPVIGLVCIKVFAIDMSGLTGLWRVLSFLGLGLALIGLGVVYRRFVLPANQGQAE